MDFQYMVGGKIREMFQGTCCSITALEKETANLKGRKEFLLVVESFYEINQGICNGWFQQVGSVIVYFPHSQHDDPGIFVVVV